MNDIELLNYALKNGIIDFTNIRQQVEKMNREECLAKHTQKVWQGKDGAYYTYLFTGEKRRLVRKTDIKVLEDSIVDHYQNKNKEDTNLYTIYIRWIKQKLYYKEICKNTYDRYCNDYKRFITGSSIDKRIEEITEKELEVFVRTTIRNMNLSAKAYSGLRTILLGVFKYAKSEGYTDISISTFFGDIPIGKKAFKVVHKECSDHVFTEDEAKLLIDYLLENPSVPNLGVVLAFQTGLREGELAALKFSDVAGNKLKVHRQEISYKDDKNEGQRIHEIVEYTKSEAGHRSIYLPDKALETISLIENINKDYEFMMIHEGKNLYAENFNNYLYRACEKVGIKKRSMHKIRKTYGTTLLDAEVDESLVMQQMGHSDIETTRKYYYFSNKNDDKKLKQIQNAIGF